MARFQLTPFLLAGVLMAPSAVAGAAPDSWAIATAETIMKRNPGTPADRLARWSYWKGYTLYGFEMLWRSTGDQRYWDFIKRQMDPFVDEKGNLTADVRLNSLDNIMAGNLMVALYEHTRDERYRAAATQIRKAFDTYPRNSDGGFWHNPRLTGEMWIDGVFMGQMFLIRYGKSIGDREYCFDEATRQIAIFARHGLKGESGLYYHAWAEQPEKTRWADLKTGLSSEVWSEGLGWYALILAETLAVLPPDHGRRPEVVDIFQRLAGGLKRTQDPKTGRWFQVVDKGDQPDNWTDTSGSAMFTYAIQRGIELGLLKPSDYAAVVDKGYHGIIAKAKIDGDELVNIYDACDGLGVQENYGRYINYKKTVNAKEAVAGFLWATAIVEKPVLEKSRKR
jgi:rhamnogalacturonyl hydrolase YesR